MTKTVLCVRSDELSTSCFIWDKWHNCIQASCNVRCTMYVHIVCNLYSRVIVINHDALNIAKPQAERKRYACNDIHIRLINPSQQPAMMKSKVLLIIYLMCLVRVGTLYVIILFKKKFVFMFVHSSNCSVHNRTIMCTVCLRDTSNEIKPRQITINKICGNCNE